MGMHRGNATCRRWIVRVVLLQLTLTSISGVLWAQRVCCEGEMWLKWNNGRRESYVWGYMIGYSHAYWVGCRRAMKSLPTGASAESIETSCRESQPDFSKGTTYWTQQVTDFYKAYASDRDINVDEILEQLSNGLTLDQIHKYPFMRRRSQGDDMENRAKECATTVNAKDGAITTTKGPKEEAHDKSLSTI
jgi:hypothetical protein